VIESNNGESLSRARRHKPKRHTAKLCPFAIRQRIVNALANGDSKRAIARALRVSNNTVTAIAEQEWQQVEARKERLAAQAERNALMAGEQIADALEQRKYPPSALVPVYGVSLDKALALRGDGPIQPHLYLHLQSRDIAREFNAFLAELDARRPERHLNSLPGDNASSLALPPKANTPNLSADGPAALRDETTEQRESPGA